MKWDGSDNKLRDVAGNFLEVFRDRRVNVGFAIVRRRCSPNDLVIRPRPVTSRLGVIRVVKLSRVVVIDVAAFE